MARLAESELDRLEQYLAAPERKECLPLDMVQGLLAAVASAPSPLPREKWLREVLGPDHAFASADEEAEITALLARFADETARQLNEAEGFDFILYADEDGEEDFATWAEGYLTGVEIAEPAWEREADGEDLDNMLFPFLALTGDARRLALEAGEEWMSDAEEDALLEDIRDGLAQHLFDVRQYWFEKSIPATVRRDTPKVGRNDPCPCGSGRKYKSCHGR